MKLVVRRGVRAFMSLHLGRCTGKLSVLFRGTEFMAVIVVWGVSTCILIHLCRHPVLRPCVLGGLS